MSNCNKNHRYFPEWEQLPDAQGDKHNARHVCPGCAFREGLKDALNGNPQAVNIDHIPRSQAGTGRHKDAKKAYDKGYEIGTQL
jgi:hypothetical protein